MIHLVQQSFRPVQQEALMLQEKPRLRGGAKDNKIYDFAIGVLLILSALSLSSNRSIQNEFTVLACMLVGAFGAFKVLSVFAGSGGFRFPQINIFSSNWVPSYSWFRLGNSGGYYNSYGSNYPLTTGTGYPSSSAGVMGNKLKNGTHYGSSSSVSPPFSGDTHRTRTAYAPLPSASTYNSGPSYNLGGVRTGTANSGSNTGGLRTGTVISKFP